MADDGPLKLMYLNPVGTPDYDHVSRHGPRHVGDALRDGPDRR